MSPLLLSAVLECGRNNKEERRRKRLYWRISHKARQIRTMRIPRAALQSPSMSAFVTLYGSGSDQALITLTGFNHCSFRYLLPKFSSMFYSYSPYSEDGFLRRLPGSGRGRPRSMNDVQCLGLVLSWNRTRGSDMVLCLIFGVTDSVCKLFLRFGRLILLEILKRDSLAAVRMPYLPEAISFRGAVSMKYPLLKNVYCFMDGLKLRLEQSGNNTIQTMFYNGWQHDHFVNCVFAFAPNGTIIAAAINAPGSMHDSQIAEWGGIYAKLEDLYNEMGGLRVVDSAFLSSAVPVFNQVCARLFSSCRQCSRNGDHGTSYFSSPVRRMRHACLSRVFPANER